MEALQGIGEMAQALWITVLVLLPLSLLGVWKLVEIVLRVCRHLHWG